MSGEFDFRALLLKIQDLLSDNDRHRLLFLLGEDVPRYLRDDPSLSGILRVLESLFEKAIISNQDCDYLIKAFTKIHCNDAAKRLQEYQLALEHFNQRSYSLQDILLFDNDGEDKMLSAGQRHISYDPHSIVDHSTSMTDLNLENKPPSSYLPVHSGMEEDIHESRWTHQIFKRPLNTREWILLISSETSPTIVASDRRDINVRAQIGGHLCDIRHAGLVKMTGALNLPSPIQDGTYSKWDRNLVQVNGTDLIVSGDGFWQTRGFQSRHGAAAILSCNTVPKVLDLEICNKTCNICARSIMKSNPAKYDSIIKSHQCEKNYDKSSGTMESAAILKMFKRSVSNIDWCGYLKSARDGTSYDHTSHAMPRPVLDAIKPVFESLCSSKSLARVVNASSQNANESFHSLVWLMSPKHKASSGITFEIACCLAIIIFYEGYFAIGDVFNAMCGYQGYYTDQAMIHFDNSRLHTESKESNRKKRKQTGHVLLQNNRKEEDSEIIDDIDQTNDDDDDGDPTDKATSEDNDTNPVAEGFDTTSDSDEPATEDNNTTSSDDQSLDDDDYGYYNANDKRKWIEEE
ncbi:unnamed protein product [Rotaria sp. Silwood1]|nr:unnamed protein product [Rotaria sp. Silwood1]